MGAAPPTLDGIVASHLAALHGEARVAGLLSSIFASTDGVMHASRARLDALPYADHFTKIRRSMQPPELRVGGGLTDLLLASIPRGKRNGHSVANPNKAVMDERTLIPATRLIFEATLTCPVDELRTLLDGIDAVGAWRAKGFGRVDYWEVLGLPRRSEVGLRWSDGSAARPLPVALAQRLGIDGPAGMARATPSYGYVLAPTEACILPRGVSHDAAPVTAEPGHGFSGQTVAEHFRRCVSTDDAETWLNRAWPNAGQGAARPLTPNSVLLLVDGDPVLAGSNLVEGVRRLPLLLSDDDQPSVYRTGRALLRGIIETPPERAYLVVWKDSNRGLSLDGAAVGAGDVVSLVTADAGNFMVDAGALRRAFAAVQHLDYKGFRRLVDLGDRLHRGVDERGSARAFDEFESLGGADAYEAVPARWSREWPLMLALFGTEPLRFDLPAEKVG